MLYLIQLCTVCVYRQCVDIEQYLHRTETDVLDVMERIDVNAYAFREKCSLPIGLYTSELQCVGLHHYK